MRPKLRQAKPDVVCRNLAGNQVTNLIKQYAEFGLPYPIVGFNLNTADAWAAGEGNVSGTALIACSNITLRDANAVRCGAARR